MKYLLTFILIFSSLSISAQVLDWNELEIDQLLTLKQEIIFVNEALTITVGSEFIVQDSIGLPIDVELYQLQLTKCAFPEKITEMILLEPENKSDRSVGIQLKQNCVLEIFVESKDLFSKSFFNKI